jgi:hypothetical protein
MNEAKTSTTAQATPTGSQRQAVKALLSNMPSLARGGPLELLYSRAWTTQASWLCAFARAAGLEARLVPLRAMASAFEQRLDAAAGSGLTVFALANMSLNLSAGAVQLAGMPAAPPIDLWQPDAEVECAAWTAAHNLPASHLIRTGRNSALELEVTGSGWNCDAGMRADGQARVSPAGAAVADVAVSNGTFVADGAIGLNRPVRWDARLAARPVTISVQDGVVNSMDCEDRGLLRFLQRAIGVHHACVITQVRVGINDRTPGFSAEQGPVNACHRGVTITLSVDPPGAYSPSSADLRIELTASREEVRHGADAESVPADR